MINDYEWADNLIDSSPKYSTGFTQLLSVNPYVIPFSVWQLNDKKFSFVRSFQKTSLELFRAAIKNDTDSTILHWLMNDTPESLGIQYHRRLEERHYTLPMFFRTDEASLGRIVEIQCPGSLWCNASDGNGIS